MLTQDVLEKVVVSVMSAVALGLLSLLSKKVRSALFYKRVEYDLPYTKGMGPVEWDIEWEGFRLTIAAGEVSNDGIDDVTIKRDKKKSIQLNRLEPSDRFDSLFDDEIQMKLNSIVRRKAGTSIDYVLRFVFRRRGFPFL